MTELAALRGEIEELKGLLRVETHQDLDSANYLIPEPRKRPIRTTSSVGQARRVLQIAGGPMYVDDIIKNIEHMTGLPVSKATLVSNLSRYVKAGDTFRRTAANTFELIPDSEKGEIRLVG